MELNKLHSVSAARLQGVVALLVADAPDVLSHCSVRARNMKVLFAGCYEPEPLQQVRHVAGANVAVCKGLVVV
jgi:hypothetical protein